MKKIICILFLITIVISISSKNEDVVLIPEKSIRFRIIANSNTKEDQNLKQEIKKELQTAIISKLNTKNYISTDENIEENIEKIDDVLKRYNVNYNISYGENYFPEKTYKGVVYPEGEYQSLVITLGEGIGDNWWCVLFPPLCLLEAEESNFEEVDYKLYVNKILNKFSH